MQALSTKSLTMTNTAIADKTDTESKIELPKKYKVLLHNDDKTTFDFVIYVLENIFHKTSAEAEVVTIMIHNQGRGIAGIYSKELAEQKAIETVNLAAANGYPLLATFEEA
jgi:ATP-dependent Clp protease adaptor protein ClpS